MPQDVLVREHFHKMGRDGSYAAFYGSRGPDTHDFYARRDRVQDFLERHVRAGQRVLDVGCGTGPMVEFFCTKGLHYFGLDVAQGMLDSIKQQFANAPYWNRIELKTGTSEHIPYPDASFDIYVGMGLLEYLDDIEPSLREIARVLKPGGLAVLTMPNLHSLHRLAVRKGRFLTRMYDLWKRFRGAPPIRRDGIVHKELAPSALDRFAARAGFKRVGRAFYDYKLIFYPLSRLFPRFAYMINRRVENRGPYFLANAFIGFYQKKN